MIQAKLGEVFEEIDVIVQPATADTAPLIERAAGGERRAGLEPEPRGNIDLGGAGNAAGLPALTLPCGTGQNGMPTALQLVAAPNREATLIRLGAEFQRRTDWHRLHPKI